jgi:aconitate hydratase
MTQVGKNSLDTRSSMTVGGKTYAYYSLAKAARRSATSAACRSR